MLFSESLVCNNGVSILQWYSFRYNEMKICVVLNSVSANKWVSKLRACLNLLFEN